MFSSFLSVLFFFFEEWLARAGLAFVTKNGLRAPLRSGILQSPNGILVFGRLSPFDSLGFWES